MTTMQGKLGRPRDAGLDARILAATRDLVQEVGYQALTMGAVAARAEVGKPTLYRRYPSKALLVFDAVFGRTREREMPDGATLEDVLCEGYRWLLEEFADPAAARAVPGLLADIAASPELRSMVLQRVVGPENARVLAVLEHARDAGELRTDVDLTLVVDAFVGTALARAVLLGRDDSDLDALAHSVVTLFLDGLHRR